MKKNISINLSSLLIGTTSTLLLFIIGYKINPNLAALFKDMSIQPYNGAYYIFKGHWVIYTCFGIFTTIFLVCKDLLCSSRHAKLLNYATAVLYLMFCIVYLLIVVMPLFDPEGFITI